MKFCVAAAVLLVSLVATTMALPAYKRMALVQQPAQLYYQPRAASQRLVYMQQYVQQRPSARTHARFVAADSVAAGSNLDDCVHPVNAASVEQQTVEESVNAEAYPAAGGQASAEFEGTYAEGGLAAGVSAAADIPASAEVPASAALPEVPDVPLSAELPEAPAADNQVLEDESIFPPAAAPELPSNDEAKVPREYNFENPAADAAAEPAVAPAEEAVPEVPAIPEIPEIPALSPEQAPAEEAAAAPELGAAPASGPSPAAAADVPLAAAPSVPAVGPVAVAPPKRYLPPRKKVTVRLDEQSEVASDDDADVDSYRPARIPNARRPAKGNGNAAAGSKGKGQLPVGTFFPINFGGTSGGAIAIANSFSTGEGGSATSHAIAYGSPDVARAKGRPVRRH